MCLVPGNEVTYHDRPSRLIRGCNSASDLKDPRILSLLTTLWELVYWCSALFGWLRLIYVLYDNYIRCRVLGNTSIVFVIVLYCVKCEIPGGQLSCPSNLSFYLLLSKEPFHLSLNYTKTVLFIDLSSTFNSPRIDFINVHPHQRNLDVAFYISEPGNSSRFL